jgi:hypothetical protein
MPNRRSARKLEEFATFVPDARVFRVTIRIIGIISRAGSRAFSKISRRSIRTYVQRGIRARLARDSMIEETFRSLWKP